MKFSTVLKFAAAALATGSLMIPGVAPANAAYPPHVSQLYASPILSGGYASVTVLGTDLASGMTVRASRGSHSKTASVHVDSSKTIGSALVKVGSLLPSTAGRYSVAFALRGGSVSQNTTQTYTVGKAITITSFKVTGKSYGLYISGHAAKSTPVKITIKFGSKTYKKTVKASRHSGNFSYRFHKTSRGTYIVTADVASNKKYFSDSVTKTYIRN